jgi:NADH-quinone oxidoreductase subunit E
MATIILPEPDHWNAASRALQRSLSKDVQRTVNLMAHPLGAMAAATALSWGMAAQWAGTWMGLAAGLQDVTRRALGVDADWPCDSDEVLREPITPAKRASATVSTLVAETEDAVLEAARAAVHVAEAAIPMVQPHAIERPERPDDLKAISGIGPKLEQRLNALGIWTYRQIADWTAAEISWMDEQLSFPGRIARDAWVKQAARLAGRSENQ